MPIRFRAHAMYSVSHAIDNSRLEFPMAGYTPDLQRVSRADTVLCTPVMKEA